MSRNNKIAEIITVAFFLLVTIINGLFFYFNRSVSEYPDADKIISAISLMKDSISHRDSIIKMSSDTVIYRSTKVKEIVKEYYTVHDTIEKLRYCDSLAEECEELAYDCMENDSLHRAQESTLKAVILKQDSVISIQGKEIVSLRKKSNRWKTASAALATAVVSILVIK